jgi:hypothetical protein
MEMGTRQYSAYPPSKERPNPPIIAATCCPFLYVLEGSSLMNPTHSIPWILGNTTPGESPRLVNSSDLFKPKALTPISTQPVLIVGVGTSLTSILFVFS